MIVYRFIIDSFLFSNNYCCIVCACTCKMLRNHDVQIPCAHVHTCTYLWKTTCHRIVIVEHCTKRTIEVREATTGDETLVARICGLPNSADVIQFIMIIMYLICLVTKFSEGNNCALTNILKQTAADWWSVNKRGARLSRLMIVTAHVRQWKTP